MNPGITQKDVQRPPFATDDAAAREHVLARYRNMRDYKQTYTQRNNVHYQQYRSHAKPRYYPYHNKKRSNIFVPYAFATVEQIVPRIVRALLNDGYNFFDLHPAEPTDSKNVEKHKKLLLWQIERMNFFIEFAMFIKTGVMYGYSCGKVDWIFQKGERRYTRLKKPFDEEGILDEAIMAKYGHAFYEEVVEENHIIYDNNRFSCLAWDDVFIDPKARYTLHTGRDFIHKTKVPLRELYQRKKPDGSDFYKNLDQISLGKGKGQYSEEDSEKDSRMSAIGASKEVWRQDANLQHDPAAQEVTLLEYWTPNWLVTVANESATIRRDPNPFWHKQIPCVDWDYTYVPNELYGIGAIESFRDLQSALNTVTNMDLDNWSMMVNQMFVVHRQADIPPEQLVSRPHGVVYSKIPPRDAVMPIQRQSVAGETTVKQQELRANLQLASGLSDFHYMGTSSGSRVGQTATGMMAVQEESNTRFQLSVALCEAMALSPLFKMMASNNQQYVRTYRWIRVTGMDAPEMVKPEDIQGSIDIRFRGAQRLVRQEMEQHNFTNFIRSVGNNPAFVAQLKPREIMREAIRKFLPDDDPERYLVPVPEEMMTPEEENYLMSFGQRVPAPTMNEDPTRHLEIHVQAQRSPDFQTWPLKAQALLDEHIELTLNNIETMQGGQMGAEPTTATDLEDLTRDQAAVRREAMGVGNNPAGGENEYERAYV